MEQMELTPPMRAAAGGASRCTESDGPFPMNEVRSEEAIFADLLHLCGSPGYVHALALLCFRDNFIRFGRRPLKAEDISHLYSRSRLIRTELSTLTGLLYRNSIDFRHPGPDALQSYLERTEALLEELHAALNVAALACWEGLL